MQKAILGKKIGMTQIFTEDGLVIPVTVSRQALLQSFRRSQLKTMATMLSR